MQTKFLRRYTSLKYLRKFLKTKELVLLNPKEWDDKNDSFYIEQYVKRKKRAGAFALCFTESSETFHHWKTFSEKGEGVCIQFDRKRLVEAAEKVDVLGGPVVYRKIHDPKAKKPKLDEFPFLKRYPYKDENEFRLFIAPMGKPLKKKFAFNVPLAAVDRITLSPWLDPPDANRKKAELKKISGCKNLNIYRSSLLENELWKKYAT